MVNLCFHGVGEPDRVLEAGEAEFWISRERFLEVIELAVRYPIRLSFDDGNASDAQLVLPALVERGLSAEFFVLAARLGHRGSLSEANLRTLAASGMVIGSHGFRHRSWRGLDAKSREEEWVVARQLISDAAGTPITRVACPFGEYDQAVLRGLRSAGYSRVYTVDDGPASPNSWLQSRYTIRSMSTAAWVERMVQQRQWRKAQAVIKAAIKRWR